MIIRRRTLLFLNLQQKLQYLKRGQEILDELPSLYCQVLSHEVDPEPVEIQMDPTLNKWKFVKSTVFKPKLDESLTGCAAVSKQVKFKATEGCDKDGAKNEVRYQTVSNMTEFENWSFEEIRWSHYVSEKIVSSSQQNKLMQDTSFDFGTSFVDLSSAKSTATSTRFSKSTTSSTTASLSGKTKNLSAKTAVFKTSNQATPTASSSGTYSFGSRISAFEKQKTSLDPTKPVPYSGKFSFDNLLAKFEQPKTSSDKDQAKSTTISTSKPFSFGTFAQPKISSVDPTKTPPYSGKVSCFSSLPTIGQLKMSSKDKATLSTSGTFGFGSSLCTIEQPKTSYLDPIKPTPYSGTATVGSSLSAFGQAQTLSADQPMPTTSSGTVSFGGGLSAFDQTKISSEQPKTSLNQATATTPSSGSFSFGAFEQSKPSSLDQTKLIRSSGTVASGSSLSTFGQLKTSVTDHLMPTKTSSSTSRFGSRLSTIEQPKTSSSDQAMPTTISSSGTSSFDFPLSTFGQPKPSSLNQSTATISSSGIFFDTVEQPKTSLEPTKPIVSSGTFSFGSSSRLSTFEQPKSTSLERANATPCSGTASYGSWSSTLGQPKTAATTTTSSSSGSFKFGAVEQPKTSLEPTKSVPSSGTFSFGSTSGLSTFEQPKSTSLDIANETQCSGTASYGSWSSTLGQPKTAATTTISSSSGSFKFGPFEKPKTSLEPTKPIVSSGTFGFGSTSGLSTFEQPKSTSSLDLANATPCSGTASYGSWSSTLGQLKAAATTTSSSSGSFKFDAFEQSKTSLEPAKPIASSGTFSFGSTSGLATFEQPKSTSLGIANATLCSGTASFGSWSSTFGQPKTATTTTTSSSGSFSFGACEQPKTSLEKTKPTPISGTAGFGSLSSVFGQLKTSSTDQVTPTTSSPASFSFRAF